MRDNPIYGKIKIIESTVIWPLNSEQITSTCVAGENIYRVGAYITSFFLSTYNVVLVALMLGILIGLYNNSKCNYPVLFWTFIITTCVIELVMVGLSSASLLRFLFRIKFSGPTMLSPMQWIIVVLMCLKCLVACFLIQTHLLAILLLPPDQELSNKINKCVLNIRFWVMFTLLMSSGSLIIFSLIYSLKIAFTVLIFNLCIHMMMELFIISFMLIATRWWLGYNKAPQTDQAIEVDVMESNV